MVVSMVSGTPMVSTDDPVQPSCSRSARRTSSTCSGMPSVRSWTAPTTSCGAGRPDASRSVVIIPVSDDESRPSRASSASRWVSSLERHSRIGIRG